MAVLPLCLCLCLCAVVLLGEGRVGKTCLCLRYVNNTFSSEQESTIQATYLEKRLNVGQRAVTLNIWDTAGQERFHALGPIYYRDSHGAVLVYDITDRDSFTKVRHWVKELRKIVGQAIVLVIAGNKADMPPQVTHSQPPTQHNTGSAVSAQQAQPVSVVRPRGALRPTSPRLTVWQVTDVHSSVLVRLLLLTPCPSLCVAVLVCVCSAGRLTSRRRSSMRAL